MTFGASSENHQKEEMPLVIQCCYRSVVVHRSVDDVVTLPSKLHIN